MIDDVARRGLKNQASRLREALALIRVLESDLEALRASYDASEATMVSLRAWLATRNL